MSTRALVLLLLFALPARAADAPSPLDARAENDDPKVAADSLSPAIEERQSPRVEGYDELRVRADLEARADRFDRAAAILSAALPRFPEDFTLRLDRAYYLLRARSYPAAAAAYREALALDPESRLARLGLADALAGAGDYRAAAVVAEALAARFPEPALIDKHAFFLFELGRYREASERYARALALDPHDVDARLGLGWCAERLHDRQQARLRFDEVIEAAPASASAREGLLLLGPDSLFIPRAFAQGWFFVNDSSRPALWNLTAGFDLKLRDRFTIAVDYRHIGDASAPLGAATSYSYSQNEGHLKLGYEARRFGLALSGAVAAFPSVAIDASATGHDVMGLFGAEAHLMAWARFSLALTWSRYADADLGQLDFGASLPLARAFDLFVGGRAAIGTGVVPGAHGSARLELRFHGRRWLLALSGQGGSEARPYDLDTRAIYNVTGTLIASAGAYAWFPILSHLDGFAGAGWERWLSATAGSSAGDSARVTLGVVAWF